MSSRALELGAESEVTAEGPAPELKVWNCLNCRKRKVRCDRRDPCAHCTKSQLSCSFPVTGRTPTRRLAHGQRREEVGWKARQRELLDKLTYLENVLKEVQADTEGKEEDAHHKESCHCDGSPGSINEPGMLVFAKSESLYVDNGFWAAFCKEVGSATCR